MMLWSVLIIKPILFLILTYDAVAGIPKNIPEFSWPFRCGQIETRLNEPKWKASQGGKSTANSKWLGGLHGTITEFRSVIQVFRHTLLVSSSHFAILTNFLSISFSPFPIPLSLPPLKLTYLNRRLFTRMCCSCCDMVALIYFRTLWKWSAIIRLSFSAWCWLPRHAWPP